MIFLCNTSYSKDNKTQREIDIETLSDILKPEFIKERIMPACYDCRSFKKGRFDGFFCLERSVNKVVVPLSRGDTAMFEMMENCPKEKP